MELQKHFPIDLFQNVDYYSEYSDCFTLQPMTGSGMIYHFKSVLCVWFIHEPLEHYAVMINGHIINTNKEELSAAWIYSYSYTQKHCCII